MAWYKGPEGSLPCYTFGGIYRDCRDVLVARRVARTCGQPHQVIQAGADFLSRFPQLAERTVYLSDGCADVSWSRAFLRMPEGARDWSRKNDWQLRRPNPSPVPLVQADYARCRHIPAGTDGPRKSRR